jgi:Flp pilus assembly pilin Flp
MRIAPGVNMLERLWRDETGLTTIEYALVLAVLGLACFTVFTLLGARVNRSASRSAATMPTAR